MQGGQLFQYGLSDKVSIMAYGQGSKITHRFLTRNQILMCLVVGSFYLFKLLIGVFLQCLIQCIFHFRDDFFLNILFIYLVVPAP